MNQKATTLSSWGLLIAKSLKDYGIDPQPLFKQAGLDPQKMQSSRERYSSIALQKVWRMAVDVTQDSAFGLKVAQHWHPTTFCALGYAWLASSNLKEAMERAVRYSRAVTDMVNLSLDKAGGAYKLSMEYLELGVKPVPESVDAAIGSLVVMTRQAYDDEINPVLTLLPREKPDNTPDFNDFFHSPIEFEAGECALLFNEDELEKPLPTANTDLAIMTDKVIEDYIANLDQNVFAMQVKSKLLDQLPTGVATEFSIANALQVSPRDLKKRLASESTTFSALLDETRNELAHKYLQESKMSLEEIAFLLGYSEATQLSAALQKWENTSALQT